MWILVLWMVLCQQSIKEFWYVKCVNTRFVYEHLKSLTNSCLPEIILHISKTLGLLEFLLTYTESLIRNFVEESTVPRDIL